MKNVRSQLFGSRTLMHSPHDIGIHTFEVEFIQFGKTARILLRRLYQFLFIQLILWTPQTSPHSIAPRESAG